MCDDYIKVYPEDDTIKLYKVTGTDRNVRSIGIMENWTEFITARSISDAKETARIKREGLQRDHILITGIFLSLD